MKKLNLVADAVHVLAVARSGAITMKEDEKGFIYPEIEKDKCVDCGLCELTCPILNKVNRNNQSDSFVAVNKNLVERKESSSGGIFVLLAKKILENNNGVVYGAGYNDKYEVVHIRIDNDREIKRLQNSKYVQSSINNIYTTVKEDLDNQKIVFFTGTPCQVNGLYSFLRKKYENLITQDFICHGVPSPKVWRKYLSEKENEYKAKITNVNFRDKKYGWNDFSMRMTFENNEYNVKHNNDLFENLFLQNLSLRDSCFNCQFKGINRIADITLGDCWGIEGINREYYDNIGTSLVMINTDKGRKIFEEIQKNIKFEAIDIDKVVKYNSALIKSVNVNEKREEFFKDFNSDKRISEIANKYVMKENVLIKILRKIKRRVLW